ncbi:MAG TPA: PepSY-associated TM helix domain-containing protein [Lacunisphaera sp.]|nr:PepSY-associated TM helix domain-containing protein [Lacunisphaera sp.]
MKLFRQILFWSHLSAGLVAGLFIGVMCFTGATLAFETELVSWSERDARRIIPPSHDAARLPLADLVKKAREANPDAPIASMAISSDPTLAVSFPLGRDGAIYANPYTGEIKAPASNTMREFMRTMTDWHRFLARTGDRRATGKAINGACNLAFCILAMTGLYLWIPRTWSWAGVKAIAVFNWKLAGKPRDFNWHNSIGLWSAPVLIVLTLTAVPISYRWGTNLFYALAGEEPPAQPSPGGASGPAVEIPTPADGTRPLSYDAQLAAVRKLFPAAELITFRLGAGGSRGGQTQTEGDRRREVPPAGEVRSESPREGGRESRGRAPQAVNITVKQPGAWPRTATTTLVLNPYTGEELKREGFDSLSTGRRIRSWTRFLHTGQALGWVGQLFAGLACLGGCFLVYTGAALSWRRFFRRKPAAMIS